MMDALPQALGREQNRKTEQGERQDKPRLRMGEPSPKRNECERNLQQSLTDKRQ